MCVCPPPAAVRRLPKYQDCHEMWSRKRRKKEGKDSGNVPPPGKHNDESQPSSPSVLPKPGQPAGSKPVPPPTTKPSPHTHSNNSNPLPPPKPLANPNLKPSLTVPLPTAPLSADILDSPPGSLQDDSNTGSGGEGILGPAPTDFPPLGVVHTKPANPVATQHLQKVIEAQRTQIALLSQITQQLQQNKHTPRLPANQVPPSLPDAQAKQALSPISQTTLVNRTQTFDYGNQSNKVLEQVAAEQLERDYQDGWQ